MDQWDKVVMDRLDETLIDLALDIGYRMGERGEGFERDCRRKALPVLIMLWIMVL